MVEDWRVFVRPADEWIVCYYAIPLPFLTSVHLFSIGHALELYLKASYVKMTGDTEAAIRFGHNLADLWRACKHGDSAFVPSLHLRDSVLSMNMMSYTAVEALDEDDRLHFLQHQEVYLIVKHLADLKYLGAPLKSVKGAYAFGLLYPNREWARLLGAIRHYLGHPGPNGLDVVRDFAESDYVPANVLDDLSLLLAARGDSIS